MTKLISLIITVIMLFESVPLAWTPTLTVDAGDRGDDVSNYATGFLYGLAEPGVPSDAIINSLDISSVSQKVVGGFQHPTGDVDRLSGQLENCDYRVVYLQDAFDTWYYCYDEIMAMREKGTYDWKAFLEERYLPIVEEKVKTLSQKEYSDDIVYCIFNECDNAVWFGNYVNGRCEYDDVGKANFYEAWKITYDLVKSINTDAKIGGPGFCDYVTEKMEGFMSFTLENDCVPEIIIYHELGFWCSVEWPKHYEDYRRIERENGLAELPIIVTEYGAMEECGNPAAMVRYIVSMEKTNTYGNMAFWRLANNLNDTCADDNSPNSNWWLYRKYAEMQGETLSVSTSALDSDALFDHDWWYHYTGLAALRPDGKEINVICNGSDNKKAVKIKNIDETNIGKIVDVTVECVYFSGLSGIVSEPYTVRKYKTKVLGDSLNINIPGTDTDTVYFVSVKEHTEDFEAVRNTNLPVRYEFEDGRLLGSAYTYDSAYATTGEVKGMCGGFENEGDGVRIKVNANQSGRYRLDIIFGKHNDGQDKNGRDYGKANFTLDGKTSVLEFENTVKSEYTTVKTLYVDLCLGVHTIEFTHNEGTFVLDSLLMSRAVEDKSIAVLENSDDGKEYLAVAPEDGYYYMSLGEGSYDISVDGAEARAENGSTVYLRRGLNEISLSRASALAVTKAEPKLPVASVEAKDITVSDGAEILTDKYGNSYLGNITGGQGKGCFVVDAPESGDYRVTLLYSNNSEGGAHAYNVDLIERYVTVSINGGEEKDIFCRNTYSDYTYKTMTFNVTLEKGENEISFTNSGEYQFAELGSEAPFIKSVSICKAIS